MTENGHAGDFCQYQGWKINSIRLINTDWLGVAAGMPRENSDTCYDGFPDSTSL